MWTREVDGETVSVDLETVLALEMRELRHVRQECARLHRLAQRSLPWEMAQELLRQRNALWAAYQARQQGSQPTNPALEAVYGEFELRPGW